MLQNVKSMNHLLSTKDFLFVPVFQGNMLYYQQECLKCYLDLHFYILPKLEGSKNQYLHITTRILV